MQDEISEAVLANEDVVRYLRGGYGDSGAQARNKINSYLEELRTTQRHKFYRALQHPLYPILRKVERIDEHVAIAQQATNNGWGWFGRQQPYESRPQPRSGGFFGGWFGGGRW